MQKKLFVVVLPALLALASFGYGQTGTRPGADDSQADVSRSYAHPAMDTETPQSPGLGTEGTSGARDSGSTMDYPRVQTDEQEKGSHRVKAEERKEDSGEPPQDWINTTPIIP
jgi:hypothetical protein